MLSNAEGNISCVKCESAKIATPYEASNQTAFQSYSGWSGFNNGDSVYFYQYTSTRRTQTFNDHDCDSCREMPPHLLRGNKSILDALTLRNINGLLDDMFLRGTNRREYLKNVLVCLFNLRGKIIASQ